MENTIAFYALIILANIWIAASHSAIKSKFLCLGFGIFWLAFAMAYGLMNGVLAS